LKKQMNKESDVQKEQEKSKVMESGTRNPNSKTKRGFMVADEEEFFSETVMHRRILKLSFLNTIQRRHIRQHQKNIEVFEQAFMTIKSTTGISDIEEIVKIFVALEQRNFSLLTYVNSLQREIEAEVIRKRDLQFQKDNHLQNEATSEARKESMLSDFNSQIAKMNAAIKEKDKINDEAAACVDDSRSLVWDIVNFLSEELPNLLHMGYEGDVPQMKTSPPDRQEESLTPYLMYIEEALLQFRVGLSNEALAPRLPACATKSAVGGTLKTSDLPSAHTAGDDSDDDPETGLGDRPMTKSELRERAQAMIARRRKKPGQQAKPHGEERRAEVADSQDSLAEQPARRAPDPGSPPPPRGDYAASSVASKESGGDIAGSAAAASASGALSKSPSGSGKQNSEGAFKGESSAPGEDDASGERKAPYRDEMWWRNQGGKGKR